MIRFGMFQAFFPKLVQGPIERSDSLLCQIRSLDKKKLLDESRIREGSLLLLWGLFQKLMVADRIAIIQQITYRLKGIEGYPYRKHRILAAIFKKA